MKVHFIAIGGSAMHNLAIALKLKGYDVTGSDDEIFEPSHSRLEKYGILPAEEGWRPEVITKNLDAVILGMHARNDNPELIRAREIGLRIFSYPEYLFEQSKDKIRIVIGGSHGKTTITAMILHVLHHAGIQADYMVGAQLDGFEVMVRLSKKAKFIILEGDEYLSSAIDPRPKFHLYRPNIALLSGIAWDHMNVFPTFEKYKEQFEIYIDLIEPSGSLIYCCEDPEVDRLASSSREDIRKIPYGILPYLLENGIVFLINDGQKIPLQIFGAHNLQNLNGAWKVCKLLGVSDKQFLKAARTFKGASKRLQLLKKSASTSVYKDFAHSPSKLKATTLALKELYPDRQLVACIELHTYSSLNIAFLPQYRGCLDAADIPVVYFNPHAIEMKKLPPLSPEAVKEAFGDDRIMIYHDSAKLKEDLLAIDFHNKNLLLMSSGNFDGMSLEELTKEIGHDL